VLPLLPLVLAAGGGLALAARRRRPAPLRRALQPGRAAPQPVGKPLARLDARWQALVQRRIDPLLMGRRRAAQLARLGTGAASGSSRRPSATPTAGCCSAPGPGAAGPGAATGWPLLPPVLALGLYNMLPFAREAWRIAVRGAAPERHAPAVRST
jgi:hypothetical protein